MKYSIFIYGSRVALSNWSLAVDALCYAVSSQLCDKVHIDVKFERI